ncbi:MAG TPA: hypothetical protein PK765_04100 [bacterium]|nr:hypothetical protein [bacterium]
MPLHPTTRASVDPANDTGSLASLAYMLDAQPSVSDPVAFGHFVEKLESARPEEIAHPEDLDRIIRVARTSNDSKVTRSLIHLGLRLIEAHVGESHWTRSACAGIDRKTFAQHVQDDHTTLSLYANLVKTHVQTSEDTAPDNFLTQYPFTKEVKGLTDVLFAAENTRMSAGTIASWRPLEYLRQCFKNHSWFNWAVHWTVLV